MDGWRGGDTKPAQQCGYDQRLAGQLSHPVRYAITAADHDYLPVGHGKRQLSDGCDGFQPGIGERHFLCEWHFAGKPLNVNNLKDVFLQAVNTVLDMSLITTLNVVVTVNGIITPVDAGTSIISGDPFSYWYIASDGVIVSGV
jgi:hypothetical protein